MFSENFSGKFKKHFYFLLEKIIPVKKKMSYNYWKKQFSPQKFFYPSLFKIFYTSQFRCVLNPALLFSC